AIVSVGAAARESRVAPGAAILPEHRRRGLRAMATVTVVVALAFWGAFAWWNSEAAAYATRAQFFRSPKCEVTLNGNRITIRPSDRHWLRIEQVDNLVADHGHVMHLFLVRTPGLDRILHLHPERTGHGTFEATLPAVEPGKSQVFADTVGQYGFPWTLVGVIDLPSLAGSPLSGDDSEGTSVPVVPTSDTTSSTLADGTDVVWKRGDAPLRANTPMILHFEVTNRNGAPANDLEPYMGMAAHAEIIRDDLSVFTHIHPSGSAPMASMMMASADNPGPPTMTDMKMPAEKIGPDISLPYGFPRPGHYRIFLQFKRAGRIETAVFDAKVE